MGPIPESELVGVGAKLTIVFRIPKPRARTIRPQRVQRYFFCLAPHSPVVWHPKTLHWRSAAWRGYSRADARSNHVRK